MNEDLSLSRAGANLVKHFEACKTKAYFCPAGVLTIGWGHTNAATGNPFAEGDVWTKAKCDTVFRTDMKVYEAGVRRLVKVTLTQYQFDALVSFAYNAGVAALQKSTLLKLVNAGDFEAAAREFAKWNKAKVNGKPVAVAGLTRRRGAEALLFQNIRDDNYDGRPDTPSRAKRVAEPEEMPQAVAPPEAPKSIINSKTATVAIGVGATAAGKAVEQIDTAVEKVDLEKVTEYAGKAGELKGHAQNLGLWDIVTQLATQPEFLLALAVIGGACFIWFDRRRKLKESQV